MDEDDIDYQPTIEMFSVPGMGIYEVSRREWATTTSQSDQIDLKPPSWWLDQQDGMGRTAAKFQIWHNRYSHSKKVAKWLMAPLDDFRRAGYLVRK